jgi:hypothetical protein
LRRLIVLLLAVSALPVAGCGDDGDSASEKYADGFKPVNQRILDLGQKVGASIQAGPTKSHRQLATEFDDHARQLGKLRGELRQLEPPGDLGQTHRQLVEAMGDVQAALEGIEKGARAGDAKSVGAAQRRLTETSKDLRRARLELARETGAKLEAG